MYNTYENSPALQFGGGEGVGGMGFNVALNDASHAEENETSSMAISPSFPDILVISMAIWKVVVGLVISITAKFHTSS